MGRAQVVQAQAAGLEPDVRMNPVLLKPTGQDGSQVVLMGKAQGNLSAGAYHGSYRDQVWPVVETALLELLAENDILVIEGAGSPAEVNLKHSDIVNMRVALAADAPVILVADIDRGGSLAAVVGTLELLEPEERATVKGIILNKFRGDVELLRPALNFLHQKTGVPVIGVVPYFDRFRIPEEDSVALEQEARRAVALDLKEQLDVAVIRLPYISNFTDFDALKDELDVRVRYVTGAGELGEPDLTVIPGSKNTLHDLNFLHRSGLGAALQHMGRAGMPLIGICGGYQMLGRVVRDPLRTESNLEELPGLGLLPMATEFWPDKHTVQSYGRVAGNSLFLARCWGQTISGYEIHMGRSMPDADGEAIFELEGHGESYADGLVAGTVLGTYLHGLFDNDGLRTALLEWLWERRGRQRPVAASVSQAALREAAFNELADCVRRNVDLTQIRAIMGLERN